MSLKLKTLTLVLTMNCNLSCPYCFCGDKTNISMCFSLAKDVLDFFKKNGEEKVNIVFFGGEPTLEMDLIKEIWYYANSIFEVPPNYSMTTNGTLLTCDLVEFMREANIDLMLSIDGFGEMHDRTRKFRDGKGSFNTIYENVKANFTLFPSIRMTYTPENVAQLSKNVLQLAGAGFHNIAFSPSDRPEWDVESLEMYCREMEKLCSIYERYLLEGEDIHFMEFDRVIRSHILPQEMWTGCEPGISQIAVDPLGRIFPCNRVIFNEENLVIGNVYEGFDKQKYEEYKKEVKWEDEDCKECILKNRCHGCYIENYENTGKLSQKAEYFCYMSQYKIKAVDRMAARLYQKNCKLFMERFYNRK